MKQTVKGTCHVIRRDRYGNIIEEYDETYETEVVSSRFDNYYRTIVDSVYLIYNNGDLLLGR